jgi:hypothetical protein
MDNVFSMAPGMIDRKAFLQRCNDAICPTCKLTKKAQCPTCGGRGFAPNMFGQVVPCTTCNGQRIIACTACEGTGVNQGFADDVLRTILRAELWALDQLSGGDAVGEERAGKASWSSVLQARQVRPVSPLGLETIIPGLDPSKCHYRNRAWVAP